MQMILSFGRKKIAKPIYRVDKKNYIELSTITVFLFIYILGLVIGNIIYLKNRGFTEQFTTNFDSMIHSFTNDNILHMLIKSCKAFIAFEAVIFLSGGCIFGMFTIFANIFLYGCSAGLLSGLAFSTGESREVLIRMMSFMPCIILFGACLCFIAIKAIFFSYELFMHAQNRSIPIKTDLKKYILANGIIFAIALFCAITLTVMVKIGSLLL